MKKCFGIIGCLLALVFFSDASAQPFIHPGINQSAADLAFMKQEVLSGKQPWKGAYERLKAATDTGFSIKPFTHVLRGPYGRPNIGGNELSESANMAYNCALLWYITGNKSYADKAIAILDAWSSTLWDFDLNDAKLLAGWTGHLLCNAAEILRYTHSGWKAKDIDRFTNLLMTVYYPLIRFYYPTANGNWNGAIIHAIMAIAVFTDNRGMFNNAVDQFLHGPVNGSIFKYIYPDGQCQESTRDQAHVQLGLGEFAGAAQVASTQGLDLFSIGGNRIALGYEYTAGFLLGKAPYCYDGPISQKAKTLRDDYEYVYRQYRSMGIDLPFTRMAADSVRPNASRSVLTSVRASGKRPAWQQTVLAPDTPGNIAGAGAPGIKTIPENAIRVLPGQSIQQALDSAAGKGRTVWLEAGIHTLKTTLRIPSNTTLAGEGTLSVIFLDPASGARDAMVNAADDLHDVTIRDLVVEGALSPAHGTDPNSSRSFRSSGNRGGIIFQSQRAGQMKHIRFIHVTVQHCTNNGILISGADDITVSGCDLNENGSSVIPGPHLLHNLKLTHCSGIRITDSRLDTSPYGSGLALSDCSGAAIDGNEVARNAFYGILISECRDIAVRRNLVEGNDRSGVMAEYLHRGSEHITITGNRIHFNGGYGVESRAVKNIQVQDNILRGNGKFTGKLDNPAQVMISPRPDPIME